MSFVITVPSSDQSKTYTIRKAGEVWTCDCADHLHRSHGKGYVCRHLAELTRSLASFATAAKKSKKAEEVLSA